MFGFMREFEDLPVVLVVINIIMIIVCRIMIVYGFFTNEMVE